MPGEAKPIAPVDKIEMVHTRERSFISAPLAALDTDKTIIRPLNAVDNSVGEAERAKERWSLVDHGSVGEVADLGVIGCLGVEVFSHIPFGQLVEGARLKAGNALPNIVKAGQAFWANFIHQVVGEGAAVVGSGNGDERLDPHTGGLELRDHISSI